MTTIVVGDIHLGSSSCRADSFNKFLNFISENKDVSLIVVNGDLWESTEISLKKRHWKVLSKIKKLIHSGIKVHLCIGNHDYPEPETLAHILGMSISDFIIVDGIYISHGMKYDAFLTSHPILTTIADFLYNWSQKIDQSQRLSKFLKSNSKEFLRNVELVKIGILDDAKKHGCDKAIASHTHHPEIRDNYANTGSWVDSPSSYIEINNGAMELKWWE